MLVLEYYSKAKALVPGASKKLGEGEWVTEWVIEYAIFLRGLAQEWGNDRNKIWHQGSLGGGWRLNVEDTEKACNTTHDYENYDVTQTGLRPIGKRWLMAHSTPMLWRRLGDNQSRYLYRVVYVVRCELR